MRGYCRLWSACAMTAFYSYVPSAFFVCVCQFSAQCRGTCRSCVLMQMLACASRGRSGGIKRRAWQVSSHDKNVLQLSRSNHNVAYMVTVCDLFLLSKEFWSLLVISVSLLSSCFFFFSCFYRPALGLQCRPLFFNFWTLTSTQDLWLKWKEEGGREIGVLHRCKFLSRAGFSCYSQPPPLLSLWLASLVRLITPGAWRSFARWRPGFLLH